MSKYTLEINQLVNDLFYKNNPLYNQTSDEA